MVCVVGKGRQCVQKVGNNKQRDTRAGRQAKTQGIHKGNTVGAQGMLWGMCVGIMGKSVGEGVRGMGIQNTEVHDTCPTSKPPKSQHSL